MRCFITILIVSLFFSSCNETKNEISEKTAPEKKDSTETSGAYAEKWSVYITEVDDMPAAILLDLGLNSVAPMKDKPLFIWITLKMKNPYENGMSSSQERPKLDEIDDAVHQTMTKELNAINAGRLNTNGYLHFYFYTSDTTGYKSLMKQVSASFREYDFTYGAYEDKVWNTYFDLLYPSPAEYQEIMNGELVNTLIESGDELEKPREVNHWIYFRTKQDRDNFIAQASKNGFTAELEEYDETESEYPYSLMVTRVDKVDLESVNEYVGFLFDLSLKNYGEYDGWETSLQK